MAMQPDRETKIRERAYQIWEHEGRPESREQEFWEQAKREVEAEESNEQGSEQGA
jgi:hypothetical protein